jgi:UDP-N-acetylglucosamine 4,6-dehydratase
MIDYCINKILSLSRTKKRTIMIISDSLFVGISLWLSFTLRLGYFFQPRVHEWVLIFLASFIAPFIFAKKGLYKSIIRYIGYKAMLAVLQATALLVMVWTIIANYFLPIYFDVNFAYFLDTLPILFWLNLVLTIGASRQIARWFLGGVFNPRNQDYNFVIYGAGVAGRSLVNSMSSSIDVNLVGILDDDLSLHGQFINNTRVIGDYNKIIELRQSYGSLTILLATPSMTSERRRFLIDYFEDKKVNVRTLPTIGDLASGAALISDVRDIDLYDLLGRAPVEPNFKLLSSCIQNKNIMVTGAGGSIGSELCRQIISLKPKNLTLVDNSEFNLYSIEKEIRNKINENEANIQLDSSLISIQNFKPINKLIHDCKINTIYHAAAYKHVPLVENNIVEGLYNNVVGTYNMAEAAWQNKVDNFVLISTDKAVRPTNIMGATKRLAELIVQGYADRSLNINKINTKYCMVRFGNVIGSSGSVIPHFKSQISSGGPVTVTHSEIIRYFMTIPEAAQLVIQAGSMSIGGEAFVLDMGEPVSIDKLARRMIHLSGYQVAESEHDLHRKDIIKIEYTGLRPGEKLYEELLIGDDVSGTSHPKIMKANEEGYEWPVIEKLAIKIIHAINEQDIEKLMSFINNYVKEYNPYDSINKTNHNDSAKEISKIHLIKS